MSSHSEPEAPAPRSSLECHLDEAVEALSFDRPDWALQELTAALAAHRGAGQPNPRPLDVDALERDVRRAVAGSASSDCGGEDVQAGASLAVVEALVFRACDLLGAHPEGPADTRVAPRPAGVARRDALRLLAAGGVATIAACSPAARRTAPVAAGPAAPTGGAPAAASATQTAGAGTTTPAPATAVVRAVTELDGLHWPTSDPFLFCAHHHDDYPQGNDAMGPAASLDGRQLGRDFDESRPWRMYHGADVPGFPRHPHRGFETVTVVRTGRLDHADSMGATARYGGGDVQWLTAGGGIQHAEMFPLLSEAEPNPLELFQIWLNLPASDKMVEPHFTMLWAERIPQVRLVDAQGRTAVVTLVAGRFDGAAPPSPPPSSWASRPDSELAIWRIELEPGASVRLPEVGVGVDRSLYLHRGDAAVVAGTRVGALSRVELDGPGVVDVAAADTAVEILLLQGRPIGEPVARRGPFVMNTSAEIQQAYEDYRATQFGGWPWAGDAPVHARDRDRFAIHPGGRLEEPA